MADAGAGAATDPFDHTDVASFPVDLEDAFAQFLLEHGSAELRLLGARLLWMRARGDRYAVSVVVRLTASDAAAWRQITDRVRADVAAIRAQLS